VKQVFGAQRPDQRILHDLVGGFGIAGQRTRITPQRRDGSLDPLPEFTQA
jgi:hypothetical protein